MDKLINNTANFLTTTGVEVAKAITVVLMGYFVIQLIVGIIKHGIAKSPSKDKTLVNFLLGIIKFVLFSVLIIIVLTMSGVSTDNVVTFASVISLGISLALQDVISNLANGFLVVTTKPFVEGEFISVDGVDGTVISISMFHTKLKTPNGQMIVVSNHTASINNVINYSRLPTRRIVINVPVSYKTGTNEVKKIVLDVAKAHPNMLKDPAPDCRLTEYGDSNLIFTLKCWVPAGKYWDTLFDLNETILDKLREANIDIDYEQVDIRIKKEGE